VHSTIERVANASAPTSKPLHESRDWSEPPLTFFDPPLRFDGSDGLRLTCRYRNETDQAVHFGVEAQDEMCFMWLYYYDAP
jgi:Copper type II ascorbate-dependent monooxygenase, C-terminal domain